MQGSTPQHYTIADFLKWDDDKELILNPKFQRGPVWGPAARSYLIDTILRGYPIPKLLLRTQVDRDNRRTIRDVVDGQQRLRTIIDFASNKLLLGPKAGEFKGLRYADLDDDYKDAFLAYKLTCEQLINASDEDVLEVFIRINSYAVPVNEPELRNARYDNDFSYLVKELVRELTPVWALGVLSNRERVRMMDQSLVAEILGFFMHGVTDGGEQQVSRLYRQTKNMTTSDLPESDDVVRLLKESVHYLADLAGEPIVKRPHYLMLVAAMMYGKQILPNGKLDFSRVPQPSALLADLSRAQEGIRQLNLVLSNDDSGIPEPLLQFAEAARSSTQRMRSRQIRFEFFCRALAGGLVG